MAIINADRVRENTTTQGTNPMVLMGAVRNFRTFLQGVGSGNQCYYAITHQTLDEFEVGLGTFTLAAGIPTLARDTIYTSSNGNALVDFSAGTKQVAVIYPGIQIDTIASNVGVAAGYANDAATYAALASVAAVNSNLYKVSALAAASEAAIYAADASASYIQAASAADVAISAAAQVSSVAQEASLALVAASNAQQYAASASAYMTQAEGYASAAQIYKVSASAYASEAGSYSSLAFVYKSSASAIATSVAAEVSQAAVYRAEASLYATQANAASSLANIYKASALAAAASANADASLSNIYRISALAAASVSQFWAEQASTANVSAAAYASLAAYYASLANTPTPARLSATQVFTGANTFTSATTFNTSVSVSGSMIVTGPVQLLGSVSVSGSFGVSGLSTFTSGVTFKSSVSVANSLFVSGLVTFTSALTINTSVSVSGTMAVIGNVGIGVAPGASKLTVAGIIESTTTGIKFPDGSTISTIGNGLEVSTGSLQVKANTTNGSLVDVTSSGVRVGFSNGDSAQTGIRSYNASNGNSAQSYVRTETGLANTFAQLGVSNSSGFPSSSISTGSAILAHYQLALAHLWTNQAGTTEYMRLNSTGLGIGTSTPDSKLTSIANFGNSTSRNFNSRSLGSGQGELAGYSFQSTFTNTADNIPRRSADIWSGFNGGAWTYEYLAFGVGIGGQNDSNLRTTERMRITGAGNVGIGTSSPGQLLTVAGTLGVTGVASFTSAVDISGATSIGGLSTFTSAVTFNTSVSVSGTMNFADNEVIRPKFRDYALTHVALASVSATTSIDLVSGNYFSALVRGSTSWVFANPPGSPNAGGFVLELTNAGGFTNNWPAAVDWPGGTPPTFTTSGVDVVVFITDDGGTTWRGVASMLDSK